MIDNNRPRRRRGLEGPEGHPEGVLDLQAEYNRGPPRQREYKWTHDDRGQHRCPRVEIVEDTKPFRRGQIHADFFHRLADCGRQEIGFPGISEATGKAARAYPALPGTTHTVVK